MKFRETTSLKAERLEIWRKAGTVSAFLSPNRKALIRGSLSVTHTRKRELGIRHYGDNRA